MINKILTHILILLSRDALAFMSHSHISGSDYATIIFIILICPLCLTIGLYIANKESSLNNELVIYIEVIIISIFIYGCSDLTDSFIGIAPFFFSVFLSQSLIFFPFLVKNYKNNDKIIDPKRENYRMK